MKRLGDLVIAATLLVITLPLMVLITLAIKWESAGPVFERQTCIARGGRRFRILTFRTTAHIGDDTLPAWAYKTTEIGQFLRQTRIEVLPRLLNVLRGELSILGGSSSPSFLD